MKALVMHTINRYLPGLHYFKYTKLLMPAHILLQCSNGHKKKKNGER